MYSIFKDRTELGKSFESGWAEPSVPGYSMMFTSSGALVIEHRNINFDYLGSESVLLPGTSGIFLAAKTKLVALLSRDTPLFCE